MFKVYVNETAFLFGQHSRLEYAVLLGAIPACVEKHLFDHLFPY